MQNPLEISVRVECITGQRSLDQLALGEAARRRLKGASREIQQVLPFMYEHSGIAARHFELDPAEMEKRGDWLSALNDATRSLAARVFEKVVTPDLAGLIVVSSTHSGFPGLSRWLQHRFELPLSTVCLDLAGTGCAGGPHALYLADVLVRSGLSSVCVLCVDALGSLSQVGEWSPQQTMSQVVAHCLASDGAAAVLLKAAPLSKGDALSYKSARFVSRLWPRSIAWNVFGTDSENRPYFSVSKEIRTELAGEVRAVLDEDTGGHPIVAHPGGVALMQAMQQSFPHLERYIDLSMHELQSHGNFGSPSVIRVWKLTLEREVQLAPTFSLLAFGPGKVTALLRYDGVVAR